MPKKDIEKREDLLLLLLAFYKKALADETIGHFFTKVVPLDLQVHIPVIADFWETILLNGRSYTGNAILPHLHVNKLLPMEDKHFNRWLQLFSQTIDTMYEGQTAETAKQRALSIATIMRIKIKNSSGINMLPS